MFFYHRVKAYQGHLGTLAAIQSLQGFITDANYPYAHGEDVNALL